MDSGEVFAGHVEHAETAGEPGDADAFAKAWRTTLTIGRRLRELATTRPYLAIGVAAGAGLAAGALVSSWLARSAALIGAGYALQRLRGEGEPLLKAGIERLARSLAG
jgi:hypothetical protein